MNVDAMHVQVARNPTPCARRTFRIPVPLGLRLLPLVLSGAVVAAPAAASPPDPVARGQVIVERDCAGCHAVGRTGDSPNPQAPRFRQLHERYDVEALSEALTEGLTVGHGPMPEWSFGPADNAAILAYLKSLEAPTKGKAKPAASRIP
ncbi:cytochrome c [Caulobacter sp. 602-1]|uniref:c-type cytochrome n=1 Tax=Caulobacter sp. 602-1 TaxID=2492472 RepID=UPI001F29D759|nr:cytochrome c [Caulobacter sp. 602-1]